MLLGSKPENQLLSCLADFDPLSSPQSTCLLPMVPMLPLDLLISMEIVVPGPAGWLSQSQETSLSETLGSEIRFSGDGNRYSSANPPSLAHRKSPWRPSDYPRCRRKNQRISLVSQCDQDLGDLGVNVVRKFPAPSPHGPRLGRSPVCTCHPPARVYDPIRIPCRYR